MDLYIYPTQENPTKQNLIDFRRILSDSITNSQTWEKLDRLFNIQQNVNTFLFTHTENQYKDEPFYFWYSTNSIKVNFEVNENEGSKSMIIGMLVYYLRYHLSDQIRKIEIM